MKQQGGSLSSKFYILIWPHPKLCPIDPPVAKQVKCFSMYTLLSLACQLASHLGNIEVDGRRTSFHIPRYKVKHG